MTNVTGDPTGPTGVDEEMRELNANRDKFFSIISHDLRNPVTFILGFSELLLSDLDTLSREDIKVYAAQINRSAKSLSNLLENLLQWAEIQRGRIDFQPVRVDLAEIVKDNTKLLAGNVHEKKIKLDNQIEDKTFVYADRNMINSVIQNLLSNAIKFTHSGGQIKIVSRVEGDHLVVSVSDTGIGMSREKISNLFEIDIHRTRPGTAGEKGTGLGLILCKEFIEQNGGKIWVESRLKKGTTFNFTVPRPPQSNQEEQT